MLRRAHESAYELSKSGQKVLAAHRAGLGEVVLPARNEGDLDEVPDEVRAGMRFHLASRVADVLDVALAPAAGEVARAA